MGPLPHNSAGRAIDIAGGDGRLSTGLLLKKYGTVDLIDICPLGVQRAKNAMSGHPACGQIQQANMMYYLWYYFYSAIFLVWCVGYLDRPELVVFLKKAQSRLIQGGRRLSRNSKPESFIIVLDNVLDEGDDGIRVKGQLPRTQKQLESIFAEAGLLILECSGRKTMPEPNRDIMIWALY